MARRVDYLLEEVRVLREVYTETTGRQRIPFTHEQRRRLAINGKALMPEEREACCQLARPATILAWFRQLTNRRYDSSSHRRKPGRPRKAEEIRALVLRLASENLGWGYTKIRDALRGMKAEIGRTSSSSASSTCATSSASSSPTTTLSDTIRDSAAVSFARDLRLRTTPSTQVPPWSGADRGSVGT